MCAALADGPDTYLRLPSGVEQTQTAGRTFRAANERELSMRIEKGVMIPLGYGKYFKADHIVGLEPIEEDRGPGRRTRVYIQDVVEPVVASRSEGAILRDMTESPREVTKVREQHQLLADILDTVSDIDPILRSIVREQGRWDLDRLEERIREILEDH